MGVDYGRSDFDVLQRGVADLVWNLPFKGSWYKSGYTISGITVVQSGQPFTVFSGPAYGQVTQLINRPTSAVHTTGNPNGYISGLSITNLPSYNPSVCPSLYAQPTLYSGSSNPNPGACIGNNGRNTFTGPAYFSQDLAMQKSTRGFKDSQSLVVRAEMYNLFNRANYYNPISEISKDGVHLNPEFGLIRSAHEPFRLQLAVRLDF